MADPTAGVSTDAHAERTNDRAEPTAQSAGAAGPGAWLELAVEADQEAVEAVSEILARVSSGGVAVETPIVTEAEGLAARPDPTRPAVVRG